MTKLEMQQLDYFVLDVFTQRRFSGNQLSVVHCPGELEMDHYHDISREFGYSETSFVYYSKEENAFKVRSFTPSGFEVTGAGHNLLGAVCLALIKGWDIFKGHGSEPWVLIKDNKIPLKITKKNDLFYVGMKQKPAQVLPGLPDNDLASSVGLAPEDLSLNGWQNKIVATEVAHLMVPVKNTAALRNATPAKQLLKALSEKYGFEGFYLFTTNLAGNDNYVAEARFFNPGIGIDEDPATGTAAGPLTGYLHQLGHVEQDKDYQILQGSIHHPSVIDVQVTGDGIWVSGSSVVVMNGVIHLLQPIEDENPTELQAKEYGHCEGEKVQ